MATYYTPIPYGDIADDDTFNDVFAELDAQIVVNTAAIGDLAILGTTEKGSIVRVIGSAPLRTDEKQRLIPAINELYDRVVQASFGYVGGNIAHLTNGTSAAGQKTVTLDETTGFLPGGWAAYKRVDDTIEYNLIAAVTDDTHLLLTTDIGATGIGDNVYVGMVPNDVYWAAQAIPHASSLTLPQAMASANGNVFNVAAFHASPSASAAVNAAAIQAAIDAAGAGVVFFPENGTYEYDTCLDMTSKRTGVTLRGAHTYGTFLSCTGTGGNCIDLTNSAYVRIENITLTTTTGTPEVGILMGRNASGDSAGNHRLTNVIVQGAYSKAAIYSCSSEVNHFDNLHIYQNAAGSYGYYHSDTNDLSVASDYETLTALAANATVATFVGGSLNHWHASGGQAMHFKNTTNLSIHGTSMHTSGTPAVGLVTFEGSVNSVAMSGVRQEGTPSYGVHVLGTFSSSVVTGCYLSGTVAGTYGANGSTIRNSSFQGVEVAGTTMQINAATMNGCTYNLNTLAGTVRTEALNNIWYNCAEDGNAYPLTLTGGIGNICYSQWSAGNPRAVINKGGVWLSDIGWGIKAATASAATTPGNVIHKVPVYDEAGNILGYVPLYDAIT